MDGIEIGRFMTCRPIPWMNIGIFEKCTIYEQLTNCIIESCQLCGSQTIDLFSYRQSLAWCWQAQIVQHCPIKLCVIEPSSNTCQLTRSEVRSSLVTSSVYILFTLGFICKIIKFVNYLVVNYLIKIHTLTINQRHWRNKKQQIYGFYIHLKKNLKEMNLITLKIIWLIITIIYCN